MRATPSCTMGYHVMQTGFRPPAYELAVSALSTLLYDLPGKLIAIDGYPGVGKTPLGRFLAWRFNVSLIETDLFLIPAQGRLVHRNEEIVRIIDRRLDIPRPVIVEGCSVLRLLSGMGRKPDFLIYVTNQSAPKPHGDLAADLAAYDAEFSPRDRAGLLLDLVDEG
jgi:hypothetical protein